MPLGQLYCCALLEIFPKSDWTPARGHGNMARKMGFYYDRLDFKPNQDSDKGSNVPLKELKNMTETVISNLLMKSSCILPDVINDPYFSRYNFQSIAWK